MPHFTVVPVDGPRRGDYDNLEGLSWVDYGERAELDDSDGRAGHPPKGIVSSGKARQLHQPHPGRQRA
uniref:Solute carrier family 12 member 4 n=1 Tax=Homo sapiens TaxID=9606 RepID=I3L4N6_HUMAN